MPKQFPQRNIQLDVIQGNRNNHHENIKLHATHGYQSIRHYRLTPTLKAEIASLLCKPSTQNEFDPGSHPAFLRYFSISNTTKDQKFTNLNSQ